MASSTVNCRQQKTIGDYKLEDFNSKVNSFMLSVVQNGSDMDKVVNQLSITDNGILGIYYAMTISYEAVVTINPDPA